MLQKLLLYLDPTIELNLGDVFKARELKEIYISASRRSEMSALQGS